MQIFAMRHSGRCAQGKPAATYFTLSSLADPYNVGRFARSVARKVSLCLISFFFSSFFFLLPWVGYLSHK